MQNDNTILVQNFKNELLVSHKIIAKFTENKEKSVLDLITRNLNELEEFGVVRFQIASVSEIKLKENPDSKPEKIYLLNEPQATLLLTFMRNNEIVISFKVRLVQEFFKMRTQFQISKPEKRADLISVSDSELDRELKTLKFILDNVSLSEKEKISCINQTLEKINFQTLENPHLKKLEPVFSLTDLLKEFGISETANRFNLKFESFGIIERQNNGWQIVNMKYGRNLPASFGNNPKYYKSTFQELLDIVL